MATLAIKWSLSAKAKTLLNVQLACCKVFAVTVTPIVLDPAVEMVAAVLGSAAGEKVLIPNDKTVVDGERETAPARPVMKGIHLAPNSRAKQYPRSRSQTTKKMVVMKLLMKIIKLYDLLRRSSNRLALRALRRNPLFSTTNQDSSPRGIQRGVGLGLCIFISHFLFVSACR